VCSSFISVLLVLSQLIIEPEGICAWSRKLLLFKAGLFEGARKTVELHKNSEAVPISFSEFISFLLKNDSYKNEYITDLHDCTAFASELHNAAQEKKFLARFIALAYPNTQIGHAIVVFPTIDKGEVFVDFTEHRSLVWARVGEPNFQIELTGDLSRFENSESYFKRVFSEQHAFLTIPNVEEILTEDQVDTAHFLAVDYDHGISDNAWRITTEVEHWTGPLFLENIPKRVELPNGMELFNSYLNQNLSMWERNSRRYQSLDMRRALEMAEAERQRKL
jgi:hypothetical protein